jgi:pimeloyl-ACP methyl ester carboxylesterase
MSPLETRHGPVHVHVRGDGPPLLLLHANPGDARDYDAIAPALAESWQVIAVDWPGYGASAPPRTPASAMLFAEVAIDLADALGLEGARVVGNSVGGYAAVRLAIERPSRVSRLVLVNPGGFTPHTMTTRAFCRIKGNEWVSRTIALSFAKRYLRVRNAWVAEILARTDAGRRDPRVAAVDAAVWRSFVDPAHDLRAMVSGLLQPTLLAWGAHDPVLPLSTDGREASRAISHARLVTFDTGHMPFAEAPDQFLAMVVPFFS